MRIYLAAPFGRADEMRTHRAWLRALGHECTSRWLDEETAQTNVAEDMREATLTKYAQDDMADVLASDLVVVFLTTEKLRGGCLVEWGIALGAHIPVVIVGSTEVVFAHLPRVKTYPTLRAALA